MPLTRYHALLSIKSIPSQRSVALVAFCVAETQLWLSAWKKTKFRKCSTRYVRRAANYTAVLHTQQPSLYSMLPSSSKSKPTLNGPQPGHRRHASYAIYNTLYRTRQYAPFVLGHVLDVRCVCSGLVFLAGVCHPHECNTLANRPLGFAACILPGIVLNLSQLLTPSL